ncbi:unnamed protein product, partial [Prorocentrum cordatum]
AAVLAPACAPTRSRGSPAPAAFRADGTGRQDAGVRPRGHGSLRAPPPDRLRGSARPRRRARRAAGAARRGRRGAWRGVGRRGLRGAPGPRPRRGARRGTRRGGAPRRGPPARVRRRLVGSSTTAGASTSGTPWRLSTTYPEHLAWYREAELKHCRVAMLAFVGFIAPDGFRIPIPQLEDPELNLYNAHGKLIGPGLGEGPMWWLLAFCGVVESLRFRDLGLGFEKLSLENAGDLNFGKGFLPQTKEGEVQMRIKELKNGRLAMLAVSGILTQSVVWQSPHFPFVPGS